MIMISNNDDKKTHEAEDKTQKEIFENEEKGTHNSSQTHSNISQPEQNAESSAIDRLLKRVEIFLENEEWKKAAEYCDKVLDLDPENQYAYEYLLYADLEVSNEKELERNVARCVRPFEESTVYKKAIGFIQPELAERIEAYNDQIKAQQEEVWGSYNIAINEVGKYRKKHDEIMKELETLNYQDIVKSIEHKKELIVIAEGYAMHGNRVIANTKVKNGSTKIGFICSISFYITIVAMILVGTLMGNTDLKEFIMFILSGVFLMLALGAVIMGGVVYAYDDMYPFQKFNFLDFLKGLISVSISFWLSITFYMIPYFYKRLSLLEKVDDEKKFINTCKEKLPKEKKELVELEEKLRRYESLCEEKEKVLEQRDKYAGEAAVETVKAIEIITNQYFWRWK